MSAPSIPNLLSLSGGRGRGRGGGSRRGGGAPSSGHRGPAIPNPDVTVQGTDGDAAVSRLSAVELGYLDDPFAQYFVPLGQRSAPGAEETGGAVMTRRLPIINRGTYTRTSALDHLISRFISSNDGGEVQKQIISLGAGTDTRPFRLFSCPSVRGLTYHELDFPVTSAKKLRTVQTNLELRRILPPDQNGAQPGSPHQIADIQKVSTWSSTNLRDDCAYFCHSLDLRDLIATRELVTPELSGVRHDVPTLLLSECCLCYLQATETSQILSHFTARIPNLAVILYEPIRPHDAFGMQMVSNLAARGIRMPTLDVYSDVGDQERRLKDAGFGDARVVTVGGAWRNWVGEEEKKRVDGCEGLDEVEEWELLAGHYVVAWAAKGGGFDGWTGL